MDYAVRGGTGDIKCSVDFPTEMSYFCNDGWKGDVKLKKDLKKYVSQSLKQEEILSFVHRDYSCYTWSIRSLDRRLRHFGPGKRLRYQAMQEKNSTGV